MTLLLNHWDGADGATVFDDEIPAITWSIEDVDGELDDSQFRFGPTSLYIPSGDSILGEGIVSPHAGNWTLETFFRVDGSVTLIGPQALLLDTGGTAVSITVRPFDGEIELKIWDVPGVSLVVDTTPGGLSIADDVWHHVALVRDGGDYSLFLDGIRIFTGAAGSSASFTDLLLSGADATDTWYDETRVIANAMYSGATYTVPTSPFSIALSVEELVYYDRVRQFTTGTGTGSLLLGSTPDTFQSFEDSVGDGNQCAYVINDQPSFGSDWEVGVGLIEVDGPNVTLHRLAVLASSNADDFVDFALAGPKDVMLPAPAQLVNDGLAAIAAHAAATTDAHDASAISIVDAGGFYTGADVEAALQEIGLEVVVLQDDVHRINHQSTASGTEKDFAISSTSSALDVNFDQVSTDGTNGLIIQLGDGAPGIEDTGYLSGASDGSGTPTAATDGFLLTDVNQADAVYSGIAHLRLIDPATETWAISGSLWDSVNELIHTFAGTKSLSASPLTTVRVTSQGTPDNFDGGKINVFGIRA